MSITRHDQECNRRQQEKTRVQYETTQVQNNIKFTSIYLHHRHILGAWYIRLYTSVYVVKLWKLNIAFFSNSQNRTRKSQGSGLLQLCFCLSVYWNNFNCVFLPSWNFLRENFWVNVKCSRIFHVWANFGKKVSTLESIKFRTRKVKNMEGIFL